MNTPSKDFLVPVPESHASFTRLTAKGDDCASETARLFQEMSTVPCDQGRNIIEEEIICLNMNVARSLAQRYSGRGENTADLEQVAYLGLVKAVQGFKPDKGHNFLAYAVPTITGEIKRHFRDHCWAVKPPRQVQDLQRNISIARQELLQEQNEEPTVDELAATLDESPGAVNEALATRGCFTPQSLDQQIGEEHSATLGDLIAAENDDVEQADNYVLVLDLIAELPREDQQIIAMRFYEGQTQEQIARAIGASQMHVSRRLAKIMTSMRAQLEPEVVPAAS